MTLQHDKGYLSRQHLSWTEWYMSFPLNYCMVVVLKKLHLYKLIHVLSYRATHSSNLYLTSNGFQKTLNNFLGVST